MTVNAPTQERNPLFDTTPGEPRPETPSTGARTLFRSRAFRLLWIGELISLLGDQFYLIALPWLVLQLTGDAFAMGLVMALGGIPRAAFMLLGGALTDRFTPRLIMLGSNLLRMVLVALLAALVLSSSIQLWMLYVLALTFGLADAFFFPASSAIIPRLVEKHLLGPANAIMQGTFQASLFAGPVLAGILIAVFGTTSTADAEEIADMTGIGIAFGIDAVTFIASAFTLLIMRDRAPATDAAPTGETDRSVLQSIRDGLTYVWQDRTVRLLFMLIALGNFLLNGPFIVGIPVMANTRLPEGAFAFGILMSMSGGGFLFGLILATILPAPAPQRLGLTLGLIWGMMGVGATLLGLSTTTPVAAAVTLVMSATNGYVSILFMTWLQKRTPEAMMGRMMSVFMFSTMGLMPVATALAGAIVEISLTALFVGGGLAMTAVAWSATLSSPTLRAMGIALEPVYD